MTEAIIYLIIFIIILIITALIFIDERKEIKKHNRYKKGKLIKYNKGKNYGEIISWNDDGVYVIKINNENIYKDTNKEIEGTILHFVKNEQIEDYWR